MKATCIVSEISHAELVDFLSTAINNDTIFYTYIDRENLHLRNGYGDSYEHKLANVLLNGGYICVRDNESYVDEKPYDTRCENKSFFDYETDCWVYKVNLNDFKRAFGEIISGNIPIDTKKRARQDRDILMENMGRFRIDDYDCYDCRAIYQYVFLNELVYC